MKIVVADDDNVSRRLLEVTLPRWGFDCTVAPNGEDAWKTLQEIDEPCIAIIDWVMPKMNGLELIHLLRQRHPQKMIYIILLTVRFRSEDIVKGLEAGADDYIVKPFEREELRARINVGRRIIPLQSEINATRAGRAGASEAERTVVEVGEL